MATYDLTGPGGTNRPGRYNPGIRTPYLVENTIDVSAINGDSGAAQNDLLNVIDVPTETLIMEAGIEVLTALTSSVTLDLGTTADGCSTGSVDLDRYVDGDTNATGYSTLTATARAIYDSGGTADTGTVLTVKVLSAASTAGKIRVWAILCDIAGVDETDRQSSAQHDTGS